MKRFSGFTLIELMVVVAIVGILAALAFPRFAGLIRKANEGSTKGKLGAVRGALHIYYADNEGWYPSGPAGFDVTYLQDSLSAGSRYLDSWPSVYTPPYHTEIDTVDSIADNDPAAADPGDDGEWVYVGNSASSHWGKIMVECYHTDYRGVLWSSY